MTEVCQSFEHAAILGCRYKKTSRRCGSVGLYKFILVVSDLVLSMQSTRKKEMTRLHTRLYTATQYHYMAIKTITLPDKASQQDEYRSACKAHRQLLSCLLMNQKTSSKLATEKSSALHRAQWW